MCGSYEFDVGWIRYCETLEDAGLTASGSNPELPKIEEVRVTDLAPVMVLTRNEIELVAMQFGFTRKAKGVPQYTLEIESRSQLAAQCCLVPASALFGFVGKRYPRKKYRISIGGHHFMAVAAVWREGLRGRPPSFALLTRPSGEGMRAYGIREPAVIAPSQWADWLSGRLVITKGSSWFGADLNVQPVENVFRLPPFPQDRHIGCWSKQLQV